MGGPGEGTKTPSVLVLDWGLLGEKCARTRYHLYINTIILCINNWDGEFLYLFYVMHVTYVRDSPCTSTKRNHIIIRVVTHHVASIIRAKQDLSIATTAVGLYGHTHTYGIQHPHPHAQRVYLVQASLLLQARRADGVEQAEHADPVRLGRVLGHLERNLNVGHGAQVVDLVGLHLKDDHKNKLDGQTTKHEAISTMRALVWFGCVDARKTGQDRIGQEPITF